MAEYDKALPFYKKALTITEQQLGENHPANSYNNLADFIVIIIPLALESTLLHSTLSLNG